MSLLPVLYTVTVKPTEQLQDIFLNYAPLIRLSRIQRASAGSPHGGSLQSGDDEHRLSPASSPVGSSPEMLKYVELTAPVELTVPDALPVEQISLCHSFAASYLQSEEATKQYIGCAFQEYCKRKSIEQKWQAGVDALMAELAAALSRELPLHVREALADIESKEESGRQTIEDTYGGFLQWIDETTPQWLDAVHQREEERRRQAAEKAAALQAAKAALAEELALGKQLPPSHSPDRSADAVSLHQQQQQQQSLLPRPSGQAVSADGSMNYDPSAALPGDGHGEMAEIQPGGVAGAGSALTDQQLRQKAIQMLEREETQMKQRRGEQLQHLQEQEDALRASLEARTQQRLETESRQRDESTAQRLSTLREQEAAIQARLRSREEERKLTLEHIAAEEELLRRRLQDKEAKRLAAEEEAKRQEAARKATMYEELRAQEEAIRRRMEQREAAAQAEAREREEAAAVQQRQEEAMQRAKEEHTRCEKEKQLRALREQEEAVTLRVRAAELADLQAREARRQREVAHQQVYAPRHQDPYGQPMPPAPSPGQPYGYSAVWPRPGYPASPDPYRAAPAPAGYATGPYAGVPAQPPYGWQAGVPYAPQVPAQMTYPPPPAATPPPSSYYYGQPTAPPQHW